MLTLRILVLPALSFLSLAACQTARVAPALNQSSRILLTFDDGPSASQEFNTTREILQQLESNQVQPDIKALFFVQTRNTNGGGSELGRFLLHYKHASGHVLGLHCGTVRGHIRHTTMSPEELGASLRAGQDDLRTITHRDPAFIRPTFWGYNDQTIGIYHTHNLKMLLTDINTRDGSQFNNLFGMRSRVARQFQRVRQAIERGELPRYRGNVPLVMSFHDLNPITATNFRSYLRMIVEEAEASGLPLADKPFYDDPEEIRDVAALRAVPAQTDSKTVTADGPSGIEPAMPDPRAHSSRERSTPTGSVRVNYQPVTEHP